MPRRCRPRLRRRAMARCKAFAPNAASPPCRPDHPAIATRPPARPHARFCTNDFSGAHERTHRHYAGQARLVARFSHKQTKPANPLIRLDSPAPLLRSARSNPPPPARRPPRLPQAATPAAPGQPRDETNPRGGARRYCTNEFPPTAPARLYPTTPSSSLTQPSSAGAHLRAPPAASPLAGRVREAYEPCRWQSATRAAAATADPRDRHAEPGPCR
jgi:hypothetical protein